MKKPQFDGFINPAEVFSNTTAAPDIAPPITVERMLATIEEMVRRFPRREQLLRIEVPPGGAPALFAKLDIRLVGEVLPGSVNPVEALFGVPVVEVEGLEHPRPVTVEMDEDEKKLAGLGVNPAGCRAYSRAKQRFGKMVLPL